MTLKEIKSAFKPNCYAVMGEKTFRIIGVGRKYVRLLHNNGLVELVRAEKVSRVVS